MFSDILSVFREDNSPNLDGRYDREQQSALSVFRDVRFVMFVGKHISSLLPATKIDIIIIINTEQQIGSNRSCLHISMWRKLDT